MYQVFRVRRFEIPKSDWSTRRKTGPRKSVGNEMYSVRRTSGYGAL